MAPSILSSDRTAWREAVAEIAEKARQTLPECNGRVEKAVTLVLAGDVELLAEGKAKVASQSNGSTSYRIVNGTCDCRDFAQAPSGWCKHRIAAGIQKRAEARFQAMASSASDDHADLSSDAPVVTPHGIDTRFITYLHGKPFVRYAGLLALAHERGLVQLTARIEFHADALVLASATAIFQDGRTFTEWADATQDNVGFQVQPHWIRMALTRAKSRCLRDALGCDLVAVEELGEE